MEKSLLVAASVALTSFVNTQANAQANAQAIADIMPDWFLDAQKQEAEIPASKNKLVIPELNVSASVLGNFELIKKDEDYWYFTAELGKDEVSPVECYVFTETDGTANTLYKIVDYELDYIAEAFEQPVSYRFTHDLSIDVFDRTPYIALDTLYTLGEGNKAKSSIVKAIAAQTDQSSAVCIHNEIGYKQTFTTLAASFIGALATGDKSDLFFESVHRMKMNGVPVGFLRERYAIDADGDVYTEVVNSFAIPVTESALTRSDITSFVWSYTDGSLISMNTYSQENEETQYSLSLWNTEGKWLVEGELQGKKIEETLAHSGSILSGFGSYLTDKKLLNSQESSKEEVMWIADANPGAVTKVVKSTINDTPKANIKAITGPMSMNYFSDENAVIQHGFVDMGPVNMEFDLIFAEGSPLL